MRGSVRKRGKRWYYYFYTIVDGKKKKIEKVGGDTKKALEALRNTLMEIYKSGKYCNNKNMVYSEYLELWFNEYVLLNCRKNTHEAYNNIIRTHVSPNLGNYKLKELSPDVLQDFINKKHLEGYAKTYLSNILGLISGSLKYAVYPMQLLKVNPCQYVNLPKNTKNKPGVKALTEDELKRILERFPETSNMHSAIMIAINTGMRGGEICALTWPDIDLNNGIIDVNGTLLQNRTTKEWYVSKPKTESSYREIRINYSLVDYLKKIKTEQSKNKLKAGKYYKNSDFVNVKADGELVTTNSLKYISRVVNHELKINFNFHMFRHTHATILLESRISPKQIQHLLGHSKISTTLDTYSHITEKMEEEILDVLESKFTTKKTQ